MINKGKVFWLSICPMILIVGYSIYHNVESVKYMKIDKDSTFNAVFVKKGWFWTTLIIWYTILRSGSINTRRFFIRYAFVTLWWILFTQGLDWFSIPPLMDLWFVSTGGNCSFDVFDEVSKTGTVRDTFHESDYRKYKALESIYRILAKNTNGFIKEGHLEQMRCVMEKNLDCSNASVPDTNSVIKTTILSLEPRVNYVSTKCRTYGGNWVGGHDPSGHMFLLTLMIMMILGEFPKIIRAKYTKKRTALSELDESTFNKFISSVVRLFFNSPIWNIINNKPESISQYLYWLIVLPIFAFSNEILLTLTLLIRLIVWENPVILLGTLFSMWCYSFLVTVIVFHTVYEQVTGFLCAYIMIVIIYKAFR